MAYLKSLELSGFKSFPDKVNIKFSDGICVVVGPNGSGKSNICDAIRWVFGEQSAKTLRGERMDDVIFGGTLKRRPVGFAEVSLTLDNSLGIIPSDFSEITVTRRYYRSGESEYFINRAPVRLRDINEMFMDTGLGRDGYSIIGQGRISEILSQKSTDRRQVFEEAAGISKYRYKKLESERKLKTTQENLERLSDIMTALSERLDPLKGQAERAKKFLSLRDSLRELEVSLWLLDLEKKKDSQDKLTSDLNTAKAHLDQKLKDSSRAELYLDELYEKQRKADLDMNTMRTETEDLRLDGQKKESDIIIKEGSIAHNLTIIERLEAEGDTAAKKIAALEAEIKEAHEKECKLSESLLGQKQALYKKLLENENALSVREDKRMEIIELRGDIEKLSADQSAGLQKLSSLESELNMLLRRKSELEADKSASLCGIEEAQNELSVLEAKLKEERETLSKIVDQEGILKTAADDTEASRRAILTSLDALQKEYAAKDARLSMLRELAAGYEGFSKSVKYIIKQSEAGRLYGILGTTADLFRTDRKYTTAIETALGGAVQNIITQDENAAKEAIEQLKSMDRGRATFLPVTAVKGTVLSNSALEEMRGYIGNAAGLIEYDKKYAGIFSFLLGRTFVFDTLDNAVSAAKATGYKSKIVTLDGQIVGTGGVMTGGSLNKSAGILSRGSQIEGLSEECPKIKAEAAKKRDELSSVDVKIGKLKEEIAKVQSQKDGANQRIGDTQREIEYLGRTIKGMIDTKESALSQITAADNRIIFCRVEIESCKSAAEGIDALISARKDSLKAAEEELISLDLRMREHDLEVADARISENSTSKDLSAAKASIDALTANREAYISENGSRRDEKKKLADENEALMQDIENLKQKLSNIHDRLSKCETTTEKAIEERLLLEAETTAQNKRCKELLAASNELTKEVLRLESKTESSAVDMETIIGRLWEAYELTPTTAKRYTVELGSIQRANALANDLKARIRGLGNINLDAIDEYEQVKEKFEFLEVQTQDLIKAKDNLSSIISGLTRQMRDIFTKRFALINDAFSKTFTELFGGGRAWMELSDDEDVLNSGIEINVQPPGKSIKSISLLSGGEQTFVAIAILFAMLKVRPTPFCVFDEVEAALDDVNAMRFGRYIESIKDKTQFIIITHRRGTMEFADIMYGVTMQERGVSELLSINVADVEKKIRI